MVLKLESLSKSQVPNSWPTLSRFTMTLRQFLEARSGSPFAGPTVSDVPCSRQPT